MEGDAGVPGEVHPKTPGLYQLTNWSYSQNIKRGVVGEVGEQGLRGGLGVKEVYGLEGDASHKLELWPKN